MGKKRGFITLATGNKHYYVLAANLLASYQRQTDNPTSFAIIAEEENEYTNLFDDTVIMECPEGSFIDKISLLKYLPYDDNIFIDADCLVYKNIDYLWDLMNDQIGVFSAVGRSLPLDSDGGWFKKEDVGQYADQIAYIAHLHGGMYFIRKDEDKLCSFHQTCIEILEGYNNYRFRMFDKPADEPIFALAMAVHNLPMIPYAPEIMCFYPSVISFEADIRKHKAVFEVPWHKGAIEGSIVHWANYNTKRSVYIREVERLYSKDSKKESVRINIKFRIMNLCDNIYSGLNTIKTVIKEIVNH